MTVVVYGKPDCSLCEKARAVVERLQPEFGYRIDDVDVTRDPALLSRYREAIPVILVDGREVARLRVTIPGLRAALASASRSRG
jgi:glutaredoxin